MSAGMSGSNTGHTRSRTQLFLKYRNQARSASRLGLDDTSGSKDVERGTHRLLEAALASTADGGTGDSWSRPLGAAPQYVEFKDQIQAEMGVIDTKMAELRQLYGRAALTTFDDTNSCDVEIDVVTKDITQRFRKCEDRLQQAKIGKGASEVEEKVRRNVQATLAAELQKLSDKFRKQQRGYLNKLRQREDPTSGTGGLAVLDDAHRGRQDDDFDAGFSEAQVMQVDSMDAFVSERESKILSIAQSVNDMAQVMKDLSVLVIDQGTLLDRIDYNMDQVATSVEEGVKQLVKAEHKQKQSRTILCIMFLVCAVIVMLVIVIAKSLITL